MTVWFQIGLLSVMILAIVLAMYTILMLRRLAKPVTITIKFTIELWHVIAIWVAILVLIVRTVIL